MRTKAGVHFVQLLDDDGVAFDNLFCVAFQVLDSQWLARRASYMEFNVSILHLGQQFMHAIGSPCRHLV
jgi:hypothetical protein